VLEGLWLKTGKASVYLDLFRYWLKIFAIAFAMGVVSGIVMSYQFGTNWSVFSDKAGPVIGPLMAYEVLTAFFLEAGFLGVMLFGMNKVGKKLHFIATLMVALGTFVSAFWILSVNSWMQTPTGYEIGANGQFISGRQLVGRSSSTPASPTASSHRDGGLPDHRLRRRRGRRLAPAEGPRQSAARKMFSMAMWMAAIVAPLQIVAGRPARPQHAGAPAGEGDGDGRPLPEPSRRRAADPVRHSQQAETRRLRDRDSQGSPR
jgi:cytochrome bd ubiquinol oxidase subunit I